MHFVGPDQLHGFEERLTTDIYPADFSWHPRWDSDERQDWFHTMRVVTDAGPALAAVNMDYDDEVTFRAVRWIYDQARSPDRPYLLTVSFIQPHDPYVARPETWNLYSDDAIDLPVTSLADAPSDPHSERLRWAIGASDIEITETQIVAARRAYYASVSDFDRRVGQILKAIDESGQRHTTVVVVTSDHGDMLGERGLWFKMSFFERSVRVPLIVHQPGRFPARRVAEAVSLVDLGPTLVSLASEEDPSFPVPLDGRTLLPHLAGDAGHDEVIGEYYAEGTTEPLYMVRRDGTKVVVGVSDPPQVYDLSDDPEELDNLAPLRGEAVERAIREIDGMRDREALTEAVMLSQQRRAFVSRVMRTQRISWDYAPPFDASSQYLRNHLTVAEMEDRTRFPRIDSDS